MEVILPEASRLPGNRFNSFPCGKPFDDAAAGGGDEAERNA